MSGKSEQIKLIIPRPVASGWLQNIAILAFHISSTPNWGQCNLASMEASFDYMA